MLGALLRMFQNRPTQTVGPYTFAEAPNATAGQDVMRLGLSTYVFAPYDIEGVGQVPIGDFHMTEPAIFVGPQVVQINGVTNGFQAGQIQLQPLQVATQGGVRIIPT